MKIGCNSIDFIGTGIHQHKPTIPSTGTCSLLGKARSGTRPIETHVKRINLHWPTGLPLKPHPDQLSGAGSQASPPTRVLPLHQRNSVKTYPWSKLRWCFCFSKIPPSPPSPSPSFLQSTPDLTPCFAREYRFYIISNYFSISPAKREENPNLNISHSPRQPLALAKSQVKTSLSRTAAVLVVRPWHWSWHVVVVARVASSSNKSSVVPPRHSVHLPSFFSADWMSRAVFG